MVKGISGRLEGGKLVSYLVDLVWLNQASIPNFSLLGSLEIAQIYLPGWGGWVGWGGSHTDYKTDLSSQLNLHWTGQLELSLAKSIYLTQIKSINWSFWMDYKKFNRSINSIAINIIIQVVGTFQFDLAKCIFLIKSIRWCWLEVLRSTPGR